MTTKNNDLDEMFFEQFEELTDEELSDVNGGWSPMYIVDAWLSLAPFCENVVGPVVGAAYTYRSYYKA